MKINNEKTDILSVLFTEEQIAARVQELADQLSADYAGKDPLFVCVLKGASFFYADICRKMSTRIFMDFIAVSSYANNSKSTGVVRIIKDLDKNITDRHVIIVEDIIDSGLTLQYLTDLFNSRKPASVKTLTLLDKITEHKLVIAPNYCGFEIPDHFVVGYGLDYSDYYRNLPYIGVLNPAVYK